MIETVIEAIIAIFIIIVFFWIVLPELASVAGINASFFMFIGVLLIIAIILSLLKR